MNDTNRNYILGAIIVILIIFIVAVWSFSGSGSGTVATSTVATTTTTATATTVSHKVSAQSIPKATTISTYLKKDSDNVYLYKDTDPSGNPEYTVIEGADPATFVALTQLADVEKPTQKDGATTVSLGSGSAAYYKDKNQVYVLSAFVNGGIVDTGIEVVQGASPASFKVLSSIYAKDSGEVYVLEVPTDATPHPAGAYSWQPYDMKSITGADSATFAVSAGSNYDAHDATHTYRAGTLVGSYP